MKKAYIHNAGRYEEEVIVASNLEEAKQFVEDDSAEFLIEPLKAYNTPQGGLGIVIATSDMNLRTNPKANMEYWDEVDAVIERHVKACINDLKNWSVKDIQLNKDGGREEDVIIDISKLVGEVLIEKLEVWCGADFPLYNQEVFGKQKEDIDNEEKSGLDTIIYNAEKKTKEQCSKQHETMRDGVERE